MSSAALGDIVVSRSWTRRVAEGGVLHVSAMAVSCDDDPANAYLACPVHR